MKKFFIRKYNFLGTHLRTKFISDNRYRIKKTYKKPLACFQFYEKNMFSQFVYSNYCKYIKGFLYKNKFLRKYKAFNLILTIKQVFFFIIKALEFTKDNLNLKNSIMAMYILKLQELKWYNSITEHSKRFLKCALRKLQRFNKKKKFYNMLNTRSKNYILYSDFFFFRSLDNFNSNNYFFNQQVKVFSKFIKLFNVLFSFKFMHFNFSFWLIFRKQLIQYIKKQLFFKNNKRHKQLLFYKKNCIMTQKTKIFYLKFGLYNLSKYIKILYYLRSNKNQQIRYKLKCKAKPKLYYTFKEKIRYFKVKTFSAKLTYLKYCIVPKQYEINYKTLSFYYLGKLNIDYKPFFDLEYRKLLTYLSY